MSIRNYLFFYLIFLSGIQVLPESHLIPASSIYVDAEGMNIQAGDTILLEAGFKSYFMMKNFIGSEDEYLTIINYGGLVEIQNDTFGYGMVMYNCRYFRLTGSGDSDHFYGIKISASKERVNGLSLDKLSSDFEIDHIEVYNTGFAGIMSKTDPRCDLSSNRGYFTQTNTVFHHNYIHNTGGEGFYIGHSYYNGWPTTCNSKPDTLYPHDIVNVLVYKNVVDSTAYDGIQMDCAVEGCEIYNNIIRNPGMADDAFGQYYGMSGIVLGGGTSGRCYNNLIVDGRGSGISVFGLGDNWVFNNVIVDAGRKSQLSADPPDHHHPYGIFCDDRTTIQGRSFNFINNTIVNSRDIGIRLWSLDSRKNRIYNNLIINPGVKKWNLNRSMIDVITPSGVYADTISRTNHLDSTEYNSLNNPYFVNTDLLNFHLKPGATVIDAGIDLDSLPNLNFDFDGTARPLGEHADIGAFEYPSMPSSFMVFPDNPVRCEGEEVIFYTTPDLPSSMFSYNWYKNGTLLFGVHDNELEIVSVGQDNAGVYFSKLTNGFNEITSNESILEVNPAAYVFAGNDTLICANQSEFQLKGFAENYTSVLWTTNGDGFFENEEVLQTYYSPGEEDKVNGLVKLFLTAIAVEPCTPISDSFFLTIDPCTGIEEEAQIEMQVFPNPATGYFSIITTNIFGYVEVQITNIIGEVISSKSLNLPAKEEIFSVDHLPSGVYLVKLISQDKEFVRKLLII